MDILIKIAQLFLCFTILVGIHELGHFLMARAFKIRVEKFYIFFDPWFSLFKFKRGDTEYGLGWLPLGGYVKIAGMIDESMDKEQMKQPVKPDEFRAKPAWQRLLVMVGGGMGRGPYDRACRADRSLELFAAQYRHRLDRPGASQIGDLDLGREAGDTIRDFPLETHDNGQSQNHHRHAQRHRDHGNTNHHSRTVAGSVMRDSARYEQFEIHPLPILHVFFMQSNINFSYFCSINRPL